MTTIYGRLSSATRQPIETAHVCVANPGERYPVEVVSTDASGFYRIRTLYTGSFELRFTAHGHVEKAIRCEMKNHPVPKNVELLPVDTCYAKRIVISGNFNNWSQDAAVMLERTDSGMFSVEISSVLDELHYRLFQPELPEITIPDYSADRYYPDLNGGYISVRKNRTGTVKIVYQKADQNRLVG